MVSACSSNPRSNYAKKLKRTDNTVYEQWNTGSSQSLKDKVNPPLPYAQQGYFFTDKANALGFDLNLEVGEVLEIECIPENEDVLVFIELFDTLEKDALAFNEKDENRLRHEITKSGNYQLRIQPAAKTFTSYNLEIISTPLYAFPVKGGNNDDIKSFWGDPRDGGKRKHEGIDIFAPKGTHLVAVVNGKVELRNGGLGGKQVWLRDNERRIRIYYAHLDEQIARDGQKVKTGDIVGTVGNTGNARTTSPHVHFGTYLSRRGAVDPLHFVKIKETLPPGIQILLKTEKQVTARMNGQLRASPDESSKVLIVLDNNDILDVLGVTATYYHVRTSFGLAGYLHSDEVESN